MPNDYEKARKARKKLGTPKTSMTIEADEPGQPDPVEQKTKPAESKPGSQEFLNAPNTYDKNTYTPDMFPLRPRPTLTKT